MSADADTIRSYPSLNIIPDRLYGNRACGFTRFRAAHSVGYDVQIMARGRNLGILRELQRHHRVLVVLAHHTNVGQTSRSDPQLRVKLEQFGFELIGPGPSGVGPEGQRAADGFFELGRDHMRRIEADRTSLLAPGFAFDPLAGQAG